MVHSQSNADLEFDNEIPDDLRIHRISVPGGWVYITYVRRKDGEEYYTSEISTLYVPGRR
ncbi:MAG: hypothetical protein U9R75_05405 [Candidatus Thermoplasmatota archaeon]|nr:hypothetical protein [Candidatus Thermoplasmatota archaeon]